jgi:hypothetical protein
MTEVLFLVSVTGVVIALSVLCLMIVRKVYGHTVMAKHNDVAGFIYAVIGVIYAVLLAFVVIVEWDMFRDAESKVQDEVQCMASVLRDAQVFDEPQRSLIMKEIVNYADIVINEEWALMAKEQRSEKAVKSIRRIFALVAEIKPANENQKIWYQEIVTRLNNFYNARNQRVQAAKDGIPAFMWSVMIIGAVITIGFSFLFGTENLWAHSLMVASLAGVITLVLLLIVALDHPYAGIIIVTPEAFLDQLARFRVYELATQ